MIIRHRIKEKLHYAYTKTDKHVFTLPNLSNGAKVLYGYLAGLQSGNNYTDKYLIKALGVSQTVLTTRKKELKDANLILIEKIDMKTYAIYIGWTTMPASKVKEEWDADEKY